ncbi:hypothetical protein [Williamsia soli]|uniref:hypothetical protein n=1 Tax=Williamsia soli TaxID=364929 RepID=UPI001A9CCEBB|nr:hypothetical protein [Williamsia soli]
MSPNVFQLSRPARKALLTTHILLSVAWFGVNLALIALDVVAFTTDDGQLVAAGIAAIVIIIPPVIPALALGTLLTGVLLGLGTRWGLVTHGWVTAKLIISVVLTALVATLLLPNALSMAEPDPGLSAEQLRAEFDLMSLLMPPIVSSVALMVATVLSVYKPVGRRQKSRRRPDRSISPSSEVPADSTGTR